MRILVVEDDSDLNRLISEMLSDEGYSIDSCFDGEEALDFLSCAQYDVIVLDIMMPRLNGLQLVKKLRAQGNHTPVLFLTALDSIQDKVTGLDSGGDYYLPKPFDFDELVAVIRAMTRKYTGNRSNIYNIADLTVDISSQTAQRGGKSISLSAKEYALLEYMIRNKGLVLTREMIENNIWNYDYEGGTNVVDVYMSYLRKKIDAGFECKLIHTVWGKGWMLRDDI